LLAQTVAGLADAAPGRFAFGLGASSDVIAAEQKRFGRVAVLRTIISRIEDGMRRCGIEPPASTGADYGT
ncbi:MAG TPA: hypothetical protein VHX40_09845, partial [Acidimicrobiales bacterium]|nr:hypothetical protein [Acidimicrobiales bacterium]